MGIVRRQSLKRTLISYVGVLIGAISVLQIYPLDWKLYGLSQFILSTATLVVPFASFGISRLTVRFFPDFADPESKHHGFLGLLLLWTLISFGFFLLVVTLLDQWLFGVLNSLGMDTDVFIDNKTFIYAISLALVLNAIFVFHASNFRRIVVPEIFNNLLLKIALPVLIILSFYGYIKLGVFKLLYTLAFYTASVGLLLYLSYLGQFSLKLDLKFITRNLLKGMFVYGIYNVLNVVGYLLSFRIDSVMITSYLGYQSNGFYSYFAYMVNIMVIPYASLVSIAGPIIAENHSRSDINPIAKLFRQSSEVLFTTGLYFIFCVWICLDPILELTPKSDALKPLVSTFLLLGIGQLINVSAGLTEPIIGYSRFYRFNLFALLLLACVNIFLNIFLIPVYGIIGAAIATSISFIVYNISQLVFIYVRFNIIPFSLVHLKVSFIFIIAYILATLVPAPDNPIFEILLRGSLFSLLFFVPQLIFKVSPDVFKLWSDVKARSKFLAK